MKQKKIEINEDKDELRYLLQMRGYSNSHYRKILDEVINKIRMKLQRPLIEVEEEKPQPKSPYDEE